VTNGQKTRTPIGPVILVGDPVIWSYEVVNSGNVTLTGVTVTDDQIMGAICQAAALAPQETLTCSATGVAQAGQYTNTGTVMGTPPVGAVVTAQDMSNYFGVTTLVHSQGLPCKSSPMACMSPRRPAPC
jgi:hypothetical protein